MKSKFLALVAIMLLTLVVGACREEASEAPMETSTDEIAGVGDPNDVSPMNAQTWLDDFTIGSEMNADGSIEMGNTGDDFAPGQMVYYAMEVGEAPEGAAVKAMWYGAGEAVVHEEGKSVTVGQKYMTFTADTTGWAKGDYRVDAWVGDERVNEQHFQVVDADDAAM